MRKKQHQLWALVVFLCVALTAGAQTTGSVPVVTVVGRNIPGEQDPVYGVVGGYCDIALASVVSNPLVCIHTTAKGNQLARLVNGKPQMLQGMPDIAIAREDGAVILNNSGSPAYQWIAPDNTVTNLNEFNLSDGSSVDALNYFGFTPDGTILATGLATKNSSPYYDLLMGEMPSQKWTNILETPAFGWNLNGGSFRTGTEATWAILMDGPLGQAFLARVYYAGPKAGTYKSTGIVVPVYNPAAGQLVGNETTVAFFDGNSAMVVKESPPGSGTFTQTVLVPPVGTSINDEPGTYQINNRLDINAAGQLMARFQGSAPSIKYGSYLVGVIAVADTNMAQPELTLLADHSTGLQVCGVPDVGVTNINWFAPVLQADGSILAGCQALDDSYTTRASTIVLIRQCQERQAGLAGTIPVCNVNLRPPLRGKGGRAR